MRFSARLHCRKRHEESTRHQNAMKCASSVDKLMPCKGLDLTSDLGQRTLMGQMLDLVSIWLRNGGIRVKNSVLDKAVIWSRFDGVIMIQDASCSEDSQRLQARGKTCCDSCYGIAGRPKIANCIKEWCLRIGFVDLTHLILQGDPLEIANHVQHLKESFPQLSSEALATLPYRDAYTRARNYFLSIPMAIQSQSLKDYLARSLKYLTPGIVAGLDPTVHKQVTNYVQALESGRMQEHEKEAMVATLVRLTSFNQKLAKKRV